MYGMFSKFSCGACVVRYTLRDQFHRYFNAYIWSTSQSTLKVMNLTHLSNAIAIISSIMIAFY